MKTIEYYFERSRVSQPPVTGERNFHVFYYLVSGVSGEEKTFLKLGHVQDYRYLQCRVRRTGATDEQRFGQLKQAFRTVGMSTRLVAQVCQLLAVILHIGNLQFSSDANHEGAVVDNLDVLDTAAEFLGVHPDLLAELFSFKTILVRKEVCTTFLDPEQAEQVRDELARTLYSLLFSWLNEHINQKLCKESFGSFIALLDLPGPQNNAGTMTAFNSVDQFCFNFANERLQNWVLQRIHDVPYAEASKEKLAITKVPYYDNAECLKMLAEPKGGIIHIMDDQARKKRSETSFIEALGKRHSGHASFSISNASRQGESAFTINHFSGPVTYTTESFLQRNANETSADILRLLRGTPGAGIEDQGSNNPFIKSLFSSKAITTQAHPRNDETIVAAQQPVRPMRAPSTRRRKGRRLASVTEEDEEDDQTVGGGNDEPTMGSTDMQCVAGQHRAALETLLSTFDQAQPWFVFCIRPNDSQLPSQVETRSVKSQVRSYGLTEMAQRLQVCYEIKMSHSEFCERYPGEFGLKGINGGADLDKLHNLRRLMDLKETQMGIGTTTVSSSGNA